MSSTKREYSAVDEPESKKKKAKFTAGETSEQSKLKQRVVLNPADCDLDFNVEGDGLLGSALHEKGFAYCWSGARANVGITRGRYCFGCKIIAHQKVDMEDTPLDQQHVCRLGISRGDDNVGNLGESYYSFGFGGTGKFSNAGKFFNYGETFGIGDTIVCAVDLVNKPLASIGFFKNGKWLGARHFDAGPNGLGVVDSPIRKLQWESAVFPHVMLKNVVVQLQFSIVDGLIPEVGYKPWTSALEEGDSLMGPIFANLQDCEVIMLVGLPASGKSTWAEKWVKEHPEKRYVLLGTNLALDKMKLPGLLRKHNYGERFDRLMDRATGIFNTMLSRASKMSRNFIIDQTNVYKSARKRKLKPFANYQKIAVVVFPKPEELKFRSKKRFIEMGKEVPAEAINEMLANYDLPMSKDMAGTDEYFDQVIFPELNRAESQRYLNEMKKSLNTRSGNLPCPPGNSVLPYNSTWMQNYQGSSIGPYTTPALNYPQSLSVTSGNWQNPCPPHLLQGASYGDHLRAGGVLPSLNFNQQNSYGGVYDHYKSDIGNINSIPGGTADHYITYPDSYGISNIGSSNIFPMGATDPCWSYMVGPDAWTSSIHGNYDGHTNVPGPGHGAADPYRSAMVEPVARSSYPYNNIGGAYLPTPGQPAFLHGLPTSSVGDSWISMARPSYGEFPTYMKQRPGGSFPPPPYQRML